jgi:non-ribosomal peptide synthetase component F
MRHFRFSNHSIPRPEPFKPLSARFGSRQTRTPESASMASDADFWRQRLAEVPLTLNLPFVLPGARSTGVSCATSAFETPEWLTEKVNETARAEVVSIFTLMMSVWQILIFRYSEQEEFIVGCSTPTGKGSFPYQPGLMHASVSERTTFVELLRLNAQRRAESVAHDGSSLDALAAVVAPDQDRERHPVFQTAVIQRQVMSERLSPATEQGTYAPCELVCVFHAGTRAIRGRIEYPSGIMAPEDSTRLATHFLNLLRAAVSLPNAPVSSLPFRAPEEYLAATDEKN